MNQIQDDLTDKYMSKQKRYNIRRYRSGICRSCTKPRQKDHYQCAECQARARAAKRKYFLEVVQPSRGFRRNRSKYA